MKSLIWKEYHENAKWAAVPLALFGGHMAIFGPRSCMNEQYLLFVSFVAAVFGGVLGFLQVVLESRGDRRALLLHRPISRSRIFLAKAIAGMGLYLVALGFPFAVNAIWIAMPGRVAEPFRWPVLLPWLADILTGVVYYFAGMLAAQRQGRWYGSRCLGFPAALLCSFLVWNLPEFSQALVAITILGGLAGVAAWGSFLTGGDYLPQPLVAKAALAVTFLIGLTVLSVEGKIIVGEMLLGEEARATTYYTLDRSGRMLIVHDNRSQGLRVTDLKGHELKEFQRKHLTSNAELRLLVAPFSAWAVPKVRSYRMLGRMYVPYANDSTPRGERWFYLADLGRLVGFDSGKRLIGSFGPDGFARPDEPSMSRFEGKLFFQSNLRTVVAPDYLAFPRGVYSVDFVHRSVKRLFAPAAGETVLWALQWRDDREDSSLAVVGTDQSVHVVDEAAQAVFSAPLAYAPKSYGLVRFGQFEGPQRFALWYSPSIQSGIARRWTLPEHLVEYDAASDEIARRTIPPLRFTLPSNMQCWFGLVTPPAELAALLGTNRDVLFGTSPGKDDELCLLSSRLADMTYSILPDPVELRFDPIRGRVLTYALLVLLNATICATLCLLLARHNAFSVSRCISWTLCGLLFGPPGLLLMIGIQEFPARIVCHYCGKQRVVDRQRCEHCGKSHTQPATDGTEIFDLTEAAAHAMSASC